MGVVWRARDSCSTVTSRSRRSRSRRRSPTSERANAYQRTLREAKTAARLNHPGVVTVYDVAEDGGPPVDRHAAGRTPGRWTRCSPTSGPLSPRQAADMGRQLLGALSVAHAAGSCTGTSSRATCCSARRRPGRADRLRHRHLPRRPRLTQTGMVMGSPGFTAPERIRGEDGLPASDLWSLGATLYAAVEGHGPFETGAARSPPWRPSSTRTLPRPRRAGPLGPVIDGPAAP